MERHGFLGGHRPSLELTINSRRKRIRVSPQACLGSLASVSSYSRTLLLGVYFRYHQHQPSLTNCRVRFVPFG